MTKDYIAVGQKIRELLFDLGEPVEPPWQSYENDMLRAKALNVAGICWCAPGEMAPACCCTHYKDGGELVLHCTFNGKEHTFNYIYGDRVRSVIRHLLHDEYPFKKKILNIKTQAGQILNPYSVLLDDNLVITYLEEDKGLND